MGGNDNCSGVSGGEQSPLVNINFFFGFARGALRCELEADAAEVVGADVVDEDDDGGRDRAGGRPPKRRRRQDLPDQFRRDDDIQEFEDGVENKQDHDGQDSDRCRDEGGDPDGGDEADAFECVGHGLSNPDYGICKLLSHRVSGAPAEPCFRY